MQHTEREEREHRTRLIAGRERRAQLSATRCFHCPCFGACMGRLGPSQVLSFFPPGGSSEHFKQDSATVREQAWRPGTIAVAPTDWQNNAHIAGLPEA